MLTKKKPVRGVKTTLLAANKQMKLHLYNNIIRTVKMLDGALVIVKCARCWNPGKNVCSDSFFFKKAILERPLVLQRKC